MRNPEGWRPSKYVWRDGRLMGSRDPRELGPASRLVADLVAAAYQRVLPQFARGRLLDLGCGKVPLYGLYRDQVSDTVCVDWPQSAHACEHLDLQCDLSEPLPLPAGGFETIVLSDVLEHLPEPALLFAEMHRLLQPGGHVVLNVPFLYWLHEEPHDYHRYTEFALRRLAERERFEVVLLERVGGAPEVIADFMAKVLLMRPRVGRALALLVQGAARMLVATPPGRRLSSTTSSKFPLGYMMVLRRPA